MSEKKAIRVAYGEALAELAATNDKIVGAGRRPVPGHDDQQVFREVSPAVL